MEKQIKATLTPKLSSLGPLRAGTEALHPPLHYHIQDNTMGRTGLYKRITELEARLIDTANAMAARAAK